MMVCAATLPARGEVRPIGTRERRPYLVRPAMRCFLALLALAAVQVSAASGQDSGRAANDPPASADSSAPTLGQVEVNHPQHAIAFLNALKGVLRDEKYSAVASGVDMYALLEHDLVNVFNEQNHERHFRKNLTSDGSRTVSLDLTVDDEVKTVYVNEHDHVASVTTKFCLDEHIDTVHDCYELYRELVQLVFRLDGSKARPAYLPPEERTATLTLPVLTRSHPSNQRVYFDIEGLPTADKDAQYCFFMDFELGRPAWCGTLPVTKPIYTSSSISKGMHILHLARDNVREYAVFFEVMEPSVNIELGRVFHPDPNKEARFPRVVEMECGVTITGGFKPGVHGSICFNMDGEMHCHYEELRMENNSTYLHYGKNNTVRRVHIDNALIDPVTGLPRLRAEDVTIKMPILIPMSGGDTVRGVSRTPISNKPRKHCVFAVLRSYFHDAKAVAISNELCFHADHPFDTQMRDIDYDNREIRLNVGSGVDAHAGENEMAWLHDLHMHEWGIYSQNGEDGVLLSILRNLKIGHFHNTVREQGNLEANSRPAGNKFYVEFGTEDGMECNTRLLRERYGWHGLLMDGGHENPDINLNKEFITAANINDLFKKHGVPENGFDLLIIDIDFNDFWVWQQIDHEKYRPRIVIIEYNGNIPIGEARVVTRNDTHVWSDSSYCGASLLAMKRLGMSLGYSLLYAESHGVNAFFVRTDILNRHFRPEQLSAGEIEEMQKLLSIEHIYRKANYFGKGWWYADLDPAQMKREGKEWVWVQ